MLNIREKQDLLRFVTTTHTEDGLYFLGLAFFDECIEYDDVFALDRQE